MSETSSRKVSGYKTRSKEVLLSFCTHDGFHSFLARREALILEECHRMLSFDFKILAFSSFFFFFFVVLCSEKKIKKEKIKEKRRSKLENMLLIKGEKRKYSHFADRPLSAADPFFLFCLLLHVHPFPPQPPHNIKNPTSEGRPICPTTWDHV